MTSRVFSWLGYACAFLFAISLLPTLVIAQPNVQGQWTTLSNTMPINPVHAALLTNGKLLVIAGSGNCPPSQAGCPLGPPYGTSNGPGGLCLGPFRGPK